LKPEKIIIMDQSIAIKWMSGEESFIKNKSLRDACPCANCSGESDIFGNIYMGNNKLLGPNNNKKYQISEYRNIGHYAIRIHWRDGHSTGIYSFDLLKALDAEK